MSYGIIVKNDIGHLLISSEFESLHCYGEAKLMATVQSGLTTFPGYGATTPYSTLRGRHIHRYFVPTAGVPLFFIKPVLIYETHGILRQWQADGGWYVDVIQSGMPPTPPKVFAFLQPSYFPPSTSAYGMATFLPSGQRAFDSRLRPLAIYAAQPVVSSQVPCNGGVPQDTGGYYWNDSYLDFDFNCDLSFNRYELSAAVTAENLMFTAPCVAQAVYNRVKRGFKRSSGLFSSQDHWSTAIWWAMYHQGYRLNTGSILAGWAMYAAGYKFYSWYESGGWFGGGSGSIESGYQPYAAKTINLSNNTIIVADARYYQ